MTDPAHNDILQPAGLVAFRRELHRNPELSNAEVGTAARVLSRLEPLGLRIRTGVAGHGLVADLDGAHPGPTLAWRADMDALPIQEESAVEYRSQNPGVMHACGHDVHTTIGVGLAIQLAARRAELHGRVRFIFQPAEEATAPAGQLIGAAAMARDGALEGVDAVLAAHCMPHLDVGHFGVPERFAWATSDVFHISLTGRMSHAAYPHEGVDTVYMAAAVIQALLALPGRRIDARTPCVLTVGMVHAGTAANILAGQAQLSGVLRTFEAHARETALAAIHQVVAQTAAALGGSAEVRLQEGAKAVENHPGLTARLRDRLEAAAGAAHVVPFPSQMGAEDFSALSTRVPGCYLFLGVANPARGIAHALHTPRFDVDEACIPFAVEHLAQALEDLGRSWAPLP